MSVYNISGASLQSIYDVDGTSLPHGYDIDGVDVFNGESKPDRDKPAYDYYSDPDPDKSYVWSYSINELKSEQNGLFTIGVQTDTHYHGEGLSFGTPLKNMTKQLYFDFICNLGDMPQGYSSDTTEGTRAQIETMIGRYTDYAESPFLIANGNHDNAAMSTPIISKSDMYSYYIGAVEDTTDIVQAGEPKMYYYKDFYECRVIVLDTCEYGGSSGGVDKKTVSLDQISWLNNVALDTEKPIIVMGHIPLVSDLTADAVVNRDAVISSLQTFINNGGTMVAYLCGHNHEQNAVKINGINYISFKNGGTFAEIVFVDFDLRTITTKVINDNNLSDRTFTF